MRQRYSDLIVNKEDSILFVLKKMDLAERKLMIVMDMNQFASLISIGDIQRSIIKGIDLNMSIDQILRYEVTFTTTQDDLETVKQRMKERRIEFMPVVSLTGELADVIFWEDLFEEELSPKGKVKLNLPVIIMAGGLGARLKPLTNVLPKPLIPICKKTIIEVIMDRFVDYDCNDFFLSVNYKADLIRYYLDSLKNQKYHIEYFQEDKPLGTAGSLHLLKNKINSTFFVSNCDIIIDQDYSEILNYHLENENEITIVAALKNYFIPYGTLTTRENGLLQNIEEKPDIVFKINTGFYILEQHLLNEIPDNQFYHITTLIENIHRQNRRVGVFPVSEKSLIDIGNWDAYLSHIRVTHAK
ncbi:MAG: nucleotidyltransferase family protein [Candidatus Electryonea clarkiae]|nr:nucleotidyltransferase family protein [Candidatus Electryonea clarkiae]MDP8285053.1 nucleotidyltransferase family protein [Candidatus Electryonea clarkiae]